MIIMLLFDIVLLYCLNLFIFTFYSCLNFQISLFSATGIQSNLVSAKKTVSERYLGPEFCLPLVKSKTGRDVIYFNNV